jgi:hypothetical protein
MGESKKAQARPCRISTIIECPPQSEGTPHLERACLRQRAGVIRLVHPLPISGSFLLSRLSLELKNAICNRASVVDIIYS